jgi:SAM-dependent methyltransferase
MVLSLKTAKAGDAADLSVWKSTKGVRSDPFLVVSFFTNDPVYRRHIERLHNGLEEFGLEYELFMIDSLGGWELNCAFKSAFVVEQMMKSGRPVIWLDADSTLERQPSLLFEIKDDFAVNRTLNAIFNSAVVYFSNSPASLELAVRWRDRCKADPLTWDQTHLQSAWADNSFQGPLSSYWLPDAYAQIFDRDVDHAETVIRQWQASREARSTKMANQLRISKDGLSVRRHSTSWRTAPEKFWIDRPVERFLADEETERDRWKDSQIAEMVGSDSLVDVGCGAGLLADYFSKSQYTGVDLSPNALLAAKRRRPSMTFRIMDSGFEPPAADFIVLNRVLSALDPAARDRFLTIAALRTKKVIIADAFGPQRAMSTGSDFESNISPTEHTEAFAARLGLRVSADRSRPLRVGDAELTEHVMLFERA